MKPGYEIKKAKLGKSTKGPFLAGSEWEKLIQTRKHALYQSEEVRSLEHLNEARTKGGNSCWLEQLTRVLESKTCSTENQEDSFI